MKVFLAVFERGKLKEGFTVPEQSSIKATVEEAMTKWVMKNGRTDYQYTIIVNGGWQYIFVLRNNRQTLCGLAS